MVLGMSGGSCTLSIDVLVYTVCVLYHLLPFFAFPPFLLLPPFSPSFLPPFSPFSPSPPSLLLLLLASLFPSLPFYPLLSPSSLPLFFLSLLPPLPPLSPLSPFPPSLFPSTRIILLKLEEMFYNYVSDHTHTEPLKLPPWDSYHRMLAHRVAAYFGLEHNVDPMDKSCVIVCKGRNTRM